MKDNDIPYVAGMFCLSHRNNTNEMQKYELPELPELPETGNIPYDNASDERLLSDEIRKAFGVDFPNIDHFQTARSVIEIPEEIISNILFIILLNLFIHLLPLTYFNAFKNFSANP